MIITTEVTIQRTRDEVWSAFTDLDGCVDRIDGILRLERLAGDGFEPGVRWRETRLENPWCC